MPRIHLKPNSPEFADSDAPKPRTQSCDMPGCDRHGEHKAPKNRGLNDYYHFCFDHVQEYNKAWDFFSGMTQSDIEAHIMQAMLWDRPTKRYDPAAAAAMEDELLKKAHEARFFHKRPHDHENQQKARQEHFRSMDDIRPAPEIEAMAIMGLEPPVDLAGIKAKYKELVKKYHPDVNRDDPKAEELLKSINMAYTILKAAFESYEKMMTGRA